ncbi:MAG: 2-oxo acid dehydrogenase subunit E2 [Ktedonobacteraceae bacterium]|nr:2-oxo acid dehydrogenase subunit E2 [Ktedonobacteraceae bacterium]
MKTVEMPKMGDTMEEGKILRWLKKEGDQVMKGEPLAEIETEKVNIEAESFTSGILRKILVPEGATAAVGAGIALVGAPDEPLVDQASQPSATNAGKPVENEGVQAAGQAIADTVPAQGRIFISPLARRLAKESQLDYHNIQGTGPNGRIIKMDIEATLAVQGRPAAVFTSQVAPSAPTVQPTPEATTLPFIVQPQSVAAATTTDDIVEIPLTSMRRAIARRLTQSMQMAPHFYVTSVIDTGKLAALRQQINEYAAKHPSPVKVSFNDLIVRAVAFALVRMPEMNVSFTEDKILVRKQIHIGVAVALEQGLIVPVLHNANQRGVLDIARETHRLGEAARAGKLRPEDVSGGTFTVSNLGMFDVDSFTAVINPPESAILAVGSIIPTPVVVDGQVVVRDRMKITLSSDHRAIDGATAARFLQEVKRLLEEPLGLLL